MEKICTKIDFMKILNVSITYYIFDHVHKYLGTYINSEGTIETQLLNAEKKTSGMISAMKKVAGTEKVGCLSTSIQLMLYDKTILPTITYNLETWNNWRKKDWKKLEQLQAKYV